MLTSLAVSMQVEDEKVAHIYSVIMLQRLDKRKDRVEISPEQLSDASTQAEVKCNAMIFNKISQSRQFGSTILDKHRAI